MHSQLRQNLLSTGNSDGSRALLSLSISDLAMIENHSPTTITITHTSSPTVLLGEESLGVAEEENIVALDAIDLTPRVLCQCQLSFIHLVFVRLRTMTQLSLEAITATISTPLSANCLRYLIYGGKCIAWHPGVKAPGTEKRTTFLFAHSLLASYSWGRPHAVGSASVMGAHL